MIAVDTGVVLRYLLRDDEIRAARAGTGALERVGPVGR